MDDGRLPTGAKELDHLLGGGVEPDCVTEFYGEAGSGKTIVCLELTRRVALEGRWVFYIDTEGLSSERLRQIAGPDLDRLVRHLWVATPKDLAEQTRAVRAACAMTREARRPVGLIVVDSATQYYRLALGGSTEDDARFDLGLELAELVTTSLAHTVPVVVTNQVWRNPRDGRLEPLGGSYLAHAAKTIVRFEKVGPGVRRAILVKHRSRPEGSAEFRITSSGID